MNTIIRKANLDDFNAINNLMLEVHNLHLKNREDVYKSTNSPMQENDFKKILNDKDRKVFIIENIENGEIAGYSNLKMMTTPKIDILVQNKFIYVDDFCVKSTYKRKGIGSKLFKFILDYSKDHGMESVQLNVWSFNEDAISFYKAMGMTERNIRMEFKV